MIQLLRRIRLFLSFAYGHSKAVVISVSCESQNFILNLKFILSFNFIRCFVVFFFIRNCCSVICVPFVNFCGGNKILFGRY